MCTYIQGSHSTYIIVMILCKHYAIPYCMYTLNVPPYSFDWPEDVFVKTETRSQETNVL